MVSGQFLFGLKKEVIDALLWLKKHHSEYKNITIDKQNLNWMGNEEEDDLP